MLSPLRKRAGQRLREPFGKAGLTVAVIALVFAMLGGAYAASGLNSKQKKEVKSIAKSFQGTGPAGAQGAAGAKGDNGSNGAQGAKGDTGAVGPQGPQGKQGNQGPAGEAGMCSAAKPECKLASGGVLTGVWSVSSSETVNVNGEGKVVAQEQAFTFADISFPVRVSPAPTVVLGIEGLAGKKMGAVFEDGTTHFYGPYPNEKEMIFNDEEEAKEENEILQAAEENEAEYKKVCPGSVGAPKAASGFLCVYIGSQKGGIVYPTDPYAGEPSVVKPLSEAGNESGVTLPFKLTTDESYLRGSWAVAG
jgi:hypothetical protein